MLELNDQTLGRFAVGGRRRGGAQTPGTHLTPPTTRPLQNLLGLAIVTLLIVYHYVTAEPRRAED